jgi:hypothetical protein
VPSKKIPNSYFLNKKCFPFKTWRLWGTSWILELDTYLVLSDYAKTRDKNIHQFLIQTENEWIEFICPYEPDWKTYKNKSLQELMLYYSKKERLR